LLFRGVRGEKSFQFTLWSRWKFRYRFRYRLRHELLRT